MPGTLCRTRRPRPRWRPLRTRRQTRVSDRRAVFWIKFDNTSNRCNFLGGERGGATRALQCSKRNVFLAIVIACFFVDTARKQGRHKTISPPFTQVAIHLNDHSPCSSFCIVCRHAGALVFFCEGKPTRAVWRTTSLQNGECMCGELSVSVPPSCSRLKRTNFDLSLDANFWWRSCPTRSLARITIFSSNVDAVGSVSAPPAACQFETKQVL